MHKPFSDPSHAKRYPKWVKDQVRKQKGVAPVTAPTKKGTYSEPVLRSILSHFLTSPKTSINQARHFQLDCIGK